MQSAMPIDSGVGKKLVYLDHHATTPVDPSVIEAMLPFFGVEFGNPGSATHQWGMEAKDVVARSTQMISSAIGTTDSELIYTSGSTESCNLALVGFCDRLKSSGHIISVKTEHRAVLDCLKKLAKKGFEITCLDVVPNGNKDAGRIEEEQFKRAIRDNTVIASVMLANNEIGVIQPLRSISTICDEHGIVLHSDATQAIGKIPVDVNALGVDLLSFSAHKFYGPKGVGGLFVRRSNKRIRIEPQIVGGGQQQGLRSGTLNVTGIVGMAKAIDLSVKSMHNDSENTSKIRDTLYSLLCKDLPNVVLNGPELNADLRLPNNLNLEFSGTDGQSLMNLMPEIGVSSGAACSAASPEPSHVLAAIGLNPDQIRCSLRFGLGKPNSAAEMEYVSKRIADSVAKLKS